MATRHVTYETQIGVFVTLDRELEAEAIELIEASGYISKADTTVAERELIDLGSVSLSIDDGVLAVEEISV